MDVDEGANGQAAQQTQPPQVTTENMEESKGGEGMAFANGVIDVSSQKS